MGEVDEGRAGSLSQNLLVARDGVIELDGPNAKLTTGEGTWTHFELGSILWIFPEAVPEVPDEAPDENRTIRLATVPLAFQMGMMRKKPRANP